MSYDLRRISFFGILFLVLLRICIGWQFLYEGLWKYQSQKTAEPWTAKGYLMNAQGPFRSYFRGLVDDPDELNWLDYDWVKSHWESWQNRFADHYELSEEQSARLDALLNGEKVFEVPLEKLPEKVEFDGSLGPLIGYAPAEKKLYLKDPYRIQKPHWDRLQTKMVTKEEEPEYHKALEELKAKVEFPPFLKKLDTDYLGQPAWTGKPITDKEGNVIEIPPGEIKAYRDMLANYENELASADRDSTYDHLNTTWGKIQEKKAELVGPVKALDKEFKDAAYGLLTPEQRQKPPLPAEPSRLASLDQRTMWMLMILGGLLIAGCFTRVAAFLGAGMVLMFYLAMPPFPGLPEVPGPEHSFIINKNLIEVVALLALTCLPTGSWFGVDAIFRRIFVRGSQGSAGKPAKPKAQKDPIKPVVVKT